jgi:hypothetical protein
MTSPFSDARSAETSRLSTVERSTGRSTQLPLFDCDPQTDVGTNRTQGIGIDFHDAGVALGVFPAPRFGGYANKLAGRQCAVDPLGTVTSAMIAIPLRAGRIVATINPKHVPPDRALQRR